MQQSKVPLILMHPPHADTLCQHVNIITEPPHYDPQAEGLKDKKFDLELIAVQKGVYNLSKSGSQLDAGDVRAASSTLSDSWVKPFEAATNKIGGADAVNAKLVALKVSCTLVFKENFMPDLSMNSHGVVTGVRAFGFAGCHRLAPRGLQHTHYK